MAMRGGEGLRQNNNHKRVHVASPIHRARCAGTSGAEGLRKNNKNSSVAMVDSHLVAELCAVPAETSAAQSCRADCVYSVPSLSASHETYEQ